jgi:hypothetical protein
VLVLILVYLHFFFYYSAFGSIDLLICFALTCVDSGQTRLGLGLLKERRAELGAHDDAMSFLFAKSKQKVGQEMVKSTKDLLAKLLSQDGQTPKVRTARALEEERISGTEE